MPQRPRPLEAQACGDQWKSVRDCLKKITSLDFQNDNQFVAASKLGEEALEPISQALEILMGADNFNPACTLICMCMPAVRLVLLNRCSPEHIRRLKTSDDQDGSNAMGRVLSTAVRDARLGQNFPLFFKLLPCLSPEKRQECVALFPTLTMQMVKVFDDDLTLVEAVHITLERIRNMPADAYLGELHSLLWLADDVERHDPARAGAMKCITWPVLTTGKTPLPVVEAYGNKLSGLLDGLQAKAWLAERTLHLLYKVPAGLQGEVLRIAVEQAVNSQDIEKGLGRLRELASLSNKMDAEFAEALKSYLVSALTQWSLQWDESDYKAHGRSLLKIQQEVQQEPQTGILGSLKVKAGRILGNADTLVHLAADFRQALRDGHLHTAARLLHQSPHPEFRHGVYGELFEAVSQKLGAVGIEVLNLDIKKIDQEDAEAAAKQASVAREMAAVLFMTGEPYYAEVATAILSSMGAGQKQVIQALVERIGTPGDTLRRNMVHALPMLCRADHSVELDCILAMVEGPGLIAHAVVDYLLQDRFLLQNRYALVRSRCSGATVALLFKALAHRVDLGAALPPIQTTVVPQGNAQGSIKNIAQEQPLDDMVALSRQMAAIELGKLNDCIRHLHQWAPGWRLLLLMNLKPGFFNSKLRLLIAKAIDSAAANPGLGKSEELLSRLTFPEAHLALSAMLTVRVAGTGEFLLSADGLCNVMRCVVDDETMAMGTLLWIRDLSESEQVMWCTAMARALIRLPDDRSEYNHAGAQFVAARAFEQRSLAAQVEAEIGHAAWVEMVSRFSPS
jgi:hypothetical protein